MSSGFTPYIQSLHLSACSFLCRFSGTFSFSLQEKNTTTHWRNQGQCTLYPVGQSHGIAGGYPRPCPEISPSLPADISAFARRYLRPWPIMPRLIPTTGYTINIQGPRPDKAGSQSHRHPDKAPIKFPPDDDAGTEAS